MADKRGRLTPVNLNKIIMSLVLAAFAFGVFAGAVFVSRNLESTSESFSRLIRQGDVYSYRYEENGSSFMFFAARMVVHAQGFAMLWCLAVIPVAAVLVPGLVFLRAFGLSLSATVIVNAVDGRGMLQAAAHLGLQNAILLLVYMVLACACIMQAARELRARAIVRGVKRGSGRGVFERLKLSSGGKAGYSTYLLGGLTASAAAALVETWIVPMLIG